MDLIDKYLGEKNKFPSGRKQYTPGDEIKVIGNKKYMGKRGTVSKNLSYPGKKEYHIEIDVKGKKIVLKNTEVEMVKAKVL